MKGFGGVGNLKGAEHVRVCIRILKQGTAHGLENLRRDN